MKPTDLYIVIPCYNEEDCLSETHKRLTKKLRQLQKQGVISERSRIVYVDDGSKDRTWRIIRRLKPDAIGLKLAHNRGHQNALLAGLMYAKKHADAIISMDADLQDDINAIDEFVRKFREEKCEIVYGVRNDRATDTVFKRNTAQLFYKLMHLLGVEMQYNSADYRLMSKRAIKELAKYNESNLFLRGIIPTIGLKATTVEYTRAERYAGESKYPLKKMLGLAWNGITSFSIKPIRAVFGLGVVFSCVSLAVLIYAVIMKMLGQTVDGWTFTICSIWLIGGIQTASIGLIGEYVGKTYIESKHRPRYAIEKIHNPYKKL